MKEFLKKINLNTLLIIGGIVLVLLYLRQCNKSSNLKDDIKIANMNQVALLDSVTTYKDQNGDLVYEKSTLIASKKELKKLNKGLYDDIDDLKNNPKIVFKETVIVIHDTVRIQTDIRQYPDGSIGLNWNHDTLFDEDNFQKLAGETRFLFDSLGIRNPITTISKNEFGMSFLTGLTKGKDSYEIFIKSNYPGFEVTNIEGAIIDKNMISSNESSVVIGPSLGYGIVFNPSGQVSHGVVVGFTLTYNLNKPIKKLFRPYGL